jgi:hypothetical protein
MWPFVINFINSNSVSVFDSEQSSHLMVDTPIYDHELPGLNFQPGNWLCWLWFYMIFHSPSI